jgi:3-deoxy-7-phosphoheptulonate synthase
MPENVQDLRVVEFQPLLPPREIIENFPISETAHKTVSDCRQEIRNSLAGEDKRLVCIIGPCSIHDPKAAIEYAEKLATLKEEVKSKINIVMRVYFEKPRTTVGWKGLINDPNLDGSYDVVKGLSIARDILLKVNNLGLPCATEFLDPIMPQYTADLVSWAAIGARTTESQTHRQMTSGLSMPVGFKNATNGSLQVALDAITSAKSPHAFVGIDMEGRTSVVKTSGNKDVHIVLRGGKEPNFKKADIAYTKVSLNPAGSERLIMVDCSHGNSNKDYTKQPNVFNDVIDQFHNGEKSILGMMLESNLESGNQKLSDSLVYGKSVTDGCIDWQQTEDLIKSAYETLNK